jgi:DNA repair exonuclease SbcCD ATPase subunit
MEKVENKKDEIIKNNSNLNEFNNSFEEIQQEIQHYDFDEYCRIWAEIEDWMDESIKDNHEWNEYCRIWAEIEDWMDESIKDNPDWAEFEKKHPDFFSKK